jgi:hypothetical protein
MASLLGERMASLLEKCPTNRREIPLVAASRAGSRGYLSLSSMQQ